MFVSQYVGIEYKQYLKLELERTLIFQCQYFLMNSLSRREEETLLKTTKAYALRECDDVVKGRFFHGVMMLLTDSVSSAFAECASGRTLSVVWACREKLQEVQGCMIQL